MPTQMSPEFASLQLTLVDRFVELAMGTYADGVHRLTNFQRRLGLGTPTDPPSNPVWVGLLGELDGAHTHAARVDVVMDAHASLPPAVPEHIAHAWPTVGAFSIQVIHNVARTHFYSMDTDDTSPLHPGKLTARRMELNEVLSNARTEHPDLAWVAGGSWLYTTSSYRSLFPPAHLATATVRAGRDSFQGMSHWGQFLDHRWHVRPALADEFTRRIATWQGDDPCALFPIATLDVRSPIVVFDAAT